MKLEDTREIEAVETTAPWLGVRLRWPLGKMYDRGSSAGGGGRIRQEV